MTDDDLTRDLVAWAAATDPAADPITVSDVADADGGVGPVAAPRTHRPRRRLAAAAAVLVIVGLGAAVAVTRDDDGSADVTTDDGSGATGPRTQIVVAAPDLDTSWWQTAHRVVLRGPCVDAVEICTDGGDATVARPLEPGTSLVADQVLDPGTYLLRVERYDCTDDDGCGAPSLDGRPAADVEPVWCDVPLDVGTGASRILVDVGPGDGGPPTCAAAPTDDAPELTVAPDWSLRPELPWSCGAATNDVNGQVPASDPEGAVAALECFEAALAGQRPVEIPVAELQAGDGLTRSWWRVLPEPVDGHQIEILRDWGLDGAEGWARMRCDGIDVETHDVDIPVEEGGPSLYVGARPAGCDDESSLPLDLPGLDDPSPAAPATAPRDTSPATAAPVPETTPPAPGTIDLVVDADELPVWMEGVERRWVLGIGGAVLAEGLIEEPGSPEGRPGGSPAVALVARGLRVPAGKPTLLTIEEYDCFGGGCSTGGDGREDSDATPASTCEAAVPPPEDAWVAVLTLRGGGRCTVTLGTRLPALTVPVAWSLRSPVAAVCPLDGSDPATGQEQRSRCLLDAAASGLTVEMPGHDPQTRTTTIIRVEDGNVTVFHRPPFDSAEGWRMETCSGVAPVEAEPDVEALGCVDQPTGL